MGNPIIPLTETREVNLTINYKINTATATFPKLFLQLLKGRTIDIKLNIFSKPDWCEARLSKDIISTKFTGEDQNFTEKLLITLKENAPAFNLGSIVINVSTNDIKGKLGIITLMKGFEGKFEVAFEVAYVPRINISLERTYYRIPPYSYQTIPINITNLGNGRTMVDLEIENVSKNWVIQIPSFIVLGANYEPNPSGTIYLIIKTDDKYDKATIKLNFNSSYEVIRELGKSEYIFLNIENDGSYKGTSSIDLTSMIIILIIIILIISFIFVIIIKKK